MDSSWFTHPTSIYLALGGASLGFTCFLIFFRWLPRYSKPPWLSIIVATFWGGFWAILFSYYLEKGIGLYIVPRLITHAYRQFVLATFVAPLVEESLKAVGILLIFFLFRKNFNSVIDGVAYAMAVGLAFAVIEDMEYYLFSYQLGEVPAELAVIMLRGFLLGFAHSTFSSCTGIALALVRFRRFGPLSVLIPLGGLGLAMFFHGANNSYSYYERATTGIQVLGFVSLITCDYFVYLCILVTFFMGNAQIKKRLKKELRAEAEAGTLDSLDYVVATSYRERLRAKVIGMNAFGFQRYHALNHYFKILSDLALARYRLSVGDRYTTVTEVNRLRADAIACKKKLLADTLPSRFSRPPVTPGGNVGWSTRL